MNGTVTLRALGPTFIAGCALCVLLVHGRLFASDPPSRPNVVWILAEDASPHIGCYGETAIETPNLDGMAVDGVRFANAFTTAPVCSTSRSALITGMYQTALGAHNHRSQNMGVKGGGNVAFYESYRLPESVRLIPRLFTEAGYFVSLEGKQEGSDYAHLGGEPSGEQLAKTDYNFLWDHSVYDDTDWRRCPKERPFFAQIMLRGGQNRPRGKGGVDPDLVNLPPYYPDHPTLRENWAGYLNSWVQTDREVGAILDDLDAAGVADNTVVFFLTDHGLTHVRGIQFLYEEGIRVPLIVRFPDKRRKGTVRRDLVLHIDVAATSLALAGIPIPETMHGVDLFAQDYQPRPMIVSGRDRCDETVDVIRCVRTERYKYIRNFLPHLPHTQPNRFKDGNPILKVMRELYAEGRLNPLQSLAFSPTRPAEELYDLDRDPHETENLAGRPEHGEILSRLRRRLYEWMMDSNDLGLIPEPILEELGRKYGNKLHVLHQEENRGLVRRLIELSEAGRRGDREALYGALSSRRPCLRYWAATSLGNGTEADAVDRLAGCLSDESPAVRVAAALATCKLAKSERAVRLLGREVNNDNLIVGMYAIGALEQAGDQARAVSDTIESAKSSRYEFTRRIADRLSAKLEATAGTRKQP